MKFGQYELLERVAVGGMAEVYRGRAAGAEGFEKWVAIKRILPEFARDERFISMMLTEARIHAAISHRNIVQIHDLGISEDGEYFIVLEYVEGHDLRAVMEAATELGVQIPDSLALHVADELAQALHFAHELKDAEGQPLGIIHRDVSPSNVLISNAGEVKLSDFGIAKRRNDHSFVGSLKGNLVYMSPEQARRVPLDRRTDVFSLGAVLFEMLTGQKVREIVDEVTGFRDVASGVVRSARAQRPDLPEAYEALLARALASDPADRFPDAAAFGAAIRELGRESDAPVGPAEMKELVELLNPPRRARSPVERSKVIRLGPEFKALSGQARGGKSAAIPDAPAELPPVILAPGVLPNQPAGGNGNGNGKGARPAWVDSVAALSAPTPDPGASMMAPTPPPPVISRVTPASRAPVSGATKATPAPRAGIPAPRAAPALRAEASAPVKAAAPPRATVPPPPVPRFDAADAAVHALEFSAGNEMEPTPPPPAVQGPYAPEVVTPIAAAMREGRLPVDQLVDYLRAPMAASMPAAPDHSPPTAVRAAAPPLDMAPTPPPRSPTLPGWGSATNAGATQTRGSGSGPNQVAPAFVAHGGSGAVAPGSRVSTPFAISAAMDQAPVPAGRRGPWRAIAFVMILALAGGAGFVHYKVVPLDVLATWPKPATLSIASDPSGATVTLDGHALPGQTPLHIEVRRDRLEHALDFTRPESLPVHAVTRFDRTVALSEVVTLPPAPPPPPPPAPPVEATPAAPVAVEPPAPPKAPSKAPTKAQMKAQRRAARKAARLAAKQPGAKQASRKESSKKAKKKENKRSTKKSESGNKSDGSSDDVEL